MQFRSSLFLIIVLCLSICLASFTVSCLRESVAPITPIPTPTKTTSSHIDLANTKDLLSSVPGVINPFNTDWPREVEGMNGRVTIPSKPLRIYTVSLGHEETVFGLVPSQRIVGVRPFTQNPAYSNVSTLAKTIEVIGRSPEQILARNPDIVIASPFATEELIMALQNVGIPVLQMELRNDPSGRVEDILFLGYALGEEQRAAKLVNEVQQRYIAVKEITDSKPIEERPRVLSITFYSDKLYVAGNNSTEGNIIETSGGINVAAEAGIERNAVTSLEGIIAMHPEIIIIPQPEEDGGIEFRDSLLNNKSLADLPAVLEKNIFLVPARFFTTLSFWNIRGAEELSKLLWPEDLADREFLQFTFPE